MRACLNLPRDAPGHLYPKTTRLRWSKVKDPKKGGGVEREGEKGREKRDANDEDPKMFFKQPEPFQGKVHLKALGECINPLGIQGESTVSGRGWCAGGWEDSAARLYENSTMGGGETGR